MPKPGLKTPFLRSKVIQEQAIGADGVFTFDMPVNPISVLLITLRPLNDTGTLANYQRYMGIAAALNRVTVTHLGAAVINMRGEDIAAFNWLRWGYMPWEANPDNTNDERRAVVLPVVFGRYPWNRQSCLPAAKRGELTLELDIDIADTGYDGMRISAEAIEFPDAKPKEYERKITISQTWAATGDNDMDLPIGNDLRGVLLWGTTGFAGASPAPSWGNVRTLLDNQETGYSGTDWEVLMADPALWGRQPNLAADHKHTVNAAGAGIEETTSVCDMNEDTTKYAYLDYDPTGDDTFVLQTAGANRFNLRVNAETADAVRAVPVEVIKV